MTINAKREIVYDYCDNNDCGECKLCVGGWSAKVSGRDCLCIMGANEEELDRALALIGYEDQADKTPEDPIIEDDPVNHPSHYTDGKIEVIDFIEDKKLGFCLGNAVKYIARAGKKDPSKEVEDLKKARWYVERRIKELEEAG